MGWGTCLRPCKERAAKNQVATSVVRNFQSALAVGTFRKLMQRMTEGMNVMGWTYLGVKSKKIHSESSGMH